MVLTRCFVLFFFLIFFLKAYVQVDAIQMGTHNLCIYKEVDKKYTGCNLKTTELLDCTYRGMCGNKIEYGSYGDMSDDIQSSRVHNREISL